jgi:uncharacterized protein (TIGR01777 family)
VGRALARHFHEQGNAVVVLSRQVQPSPWRTVLWSGAEPGEWTREIDGADVVINLAGRSVNCRYNQQNRHEIMESRVASTRVIGAAIAGAIHPPALWMNASTATIYRHALDRPMNEVTGEIGGGEAGAPSTWRFSTDVATRWEQTFFAAETPHTRKIALRSAMIMGPESGGIFDTLRKLVCARLGGRAASGEQYISWIHEVDFLSAIDLLIARSDISGPVNLCSPEPLANKDFMECLRKACGVKLGLPGTRWMLEIGAFFLGTETELILKSRRVEPRRLLEMGFEFKFPQWPEAASDLGQRRRNA